MKRIAVSAASLLLTLSLLLTGSGCSGISASAGDLMEDIVPNEVEALADLTGYGAKAADFGIRLLKACEKGEKGTLISPLSVLCALAMTANGARGETREQMETVLGFGIGELNLYLYSYLKTLGESEKCRMHVADSVWIRENELNVEQAFLQTCADHYGADIYEAPFDRSTLRDINNWVKKNTDGMIPEILDRIPDEAVMYLVNALAFDAEWQSIYEKQQVSDGVFHADGGDRTVPFMRSEEHRYLKDGDRAEGFLKYYASGDYAFAALLPAEGVSLDDYLASLDGEKLNAILTSCSAVPVRAAIPKFNAEFGTELSDALSEMGMPLAFDENRADFTGIATVKKGNLYISRVIHKAFISVAEKGTKAGAATAVEVGNKSSAPMDDFRTVTLDRPFLYMLIDTQTSTPFFIGTLTDTGK